MCTNPDKDIENEMHILFTCDSSDNLREIMFNKMLEAIQYFFINMLILDKLKILFNNFT